MVWSVLLLALAAFSIMVVRRHSFDAGAAADPDLLRGFSYVGAGAAAALAVMVAVVSVVTPTGARADSLAVLGLFGLTAYYLVGLILWRFRAR